MPRAEAVTRAAQDITATIPLLEQAYTQNATPQEFADFALHEYSRDQIQGLAQNDVNVIIEGIERAKRDSPLCSAGGELFIRGIFAALKAGLERTR